MADIDPKDIQGNILTGFLKDHQTFMMLAFGSDDEAVAKARAWFRGEAGDQVATLEEVQAFNKLFKSLRARRGEHAIVKATWMNVAFTKSGLNKMGVTDQDIAALDPAFAGDVLARARDVLGDSGPSGSDHWKPAYREQRVDAVIILASDGESDLRDEEEYFSQQLEDNGVEVLRLERGHARTDRPGHEHFGFKDGISQPRVQGIDDDGDLAPWLFLVDATAQPVPAPLPQPPYPPQPTPPPPIGKPKWSHQGSYLVFRRLRQLVPDWQRFVETSCAQHGSEQFAAKVVGRYENGAPYERIRSLPSYDPTAGPPTSFGDGRPTVPAHINDFDFTQDVDGQLMPYAAHIRKTNPRDAAVSAKRIMRRGIAYGEPYDPEADSGSPRSADADRGLLFACYQASIADQFEFIQQQWANEPDFPQGHDPKPGVDVLIGQPKDRRRFFSVPGPESTPDVGGIHNFVLTTGTLYCFAPAISQLRVLGIG